jgi:glycosyltransferase involved in cell wall biosynthesis
MRLREELGAAAREITLLNPVKGSRDLAGRFPGSPADWWLTAELFCEEECPGLWRFVRERRCRLAAVYHDSIPLKLPHITWPQSVARHAEYVKMLAEFDRVFAVSEASKRELLELWAWQGVEPRAIVETVSLGSDFSKQPRVMQEERKRENALLCVGILEPRKNQAFLLDVCESLWRDGLTFDLHLVGRVNPHFGGATLAKIRAAQKTWRCVHFHQGLDDSDLVRLYAEARASAFPTIAEGCGLPLLESLWMGVPCLCSDLPVLRENADGGGCLSIPTNDSRAWSEALAKVMTDQATCDTLVREVVTRPLPTWSAAAQSLVARLS